MTAPTTVPAAQAYARLLARTGPPPAQPSRAQMQMRAWILRAVAETWDDRAARGTLNDAIWGCRDPRDFPEAVMQMVADAMPGIGDLKTHDMESCSCLGCSFFMVYDWASLDDVAYVVATPSPAS